MRQDEAHRALDVFSGRWHAEGTSYNQDQPVPWISDETYEWLSGGFFLLHRWHARVGETIFIGTEILGHDQDRGYFSVMFDNSGNHPEYRITRNADEWSFDEPQTRAKVRVTDNVMHWRWEWKKGGPDWRPLCDRVAKRA